MPKPSRKVIIETPHCEAVDLEARLAQLESVIVRLKTSETERLTNQRDIAIRIVRDCIETINAFLAGKNSRDDLRWHAAAIARELEKNFTQL
jgi:hypothetical protein